MVRDFIPLDSYKVKQVLKSTLDMTEGDFSGNKLGLSSKVIPVVTLNHMDLKQKRITQADIDNGKIVSIFDDGGLKKVIRIIFWQSNTETDAKNFTLHGETLSGEIIETQLSIANDGNKIIELHYTDYLEWNVQNFDAYTNPPELFLKNMWVSQDSADGTAQSIVIQVSYYE